MNLLVLSLATFALAAPADSEQAVIDRLKTVASVYVSYGEGARRQVTRLDVRITGNQEPKEVAAALRELEKLNRLESILLLGPAFTDESIGELTRVKSLREVQLHGTKVTDAGIKKLAALTELRRFTFVGTGLTDAGLKEIAAWKHLQTLELTDAPITDAGLPAIRELTGLQRLSIINSRATPRALKLLFASLPNLESVRPPRIDNF